MTNRTFQSIEKAISSNRLATYKTLPSSTSDEKTISNYVYNAKISENFYQLLQNLEVALRNSIYDSYSQHSFSRNFFYIRESNTTRHYNREYHSYACWKMIGTVKYHLTRSGITVTDGKVIAELNFGFWTTLLEDNHYKTLIWRTIFQDAFPNYIITTTIDDAVDDVSDKINKIRNFRNRIFHYEPIINRSDLNIMRNSILEVLKWINLDMYKLTKLFDEYDFLKTEQRRVDKLLSTLDTTSVLKKRKVKKMKKNSK